MALNVLASKFKEVVSAVLPITLIVLILNWTLSPLGFPVLLRFLAGALLIILGLSIFLFGVDLGVSPIGVLMGSTLTKSNKLWIMVAGGLLLGFFISVAEPDLHILANQVDFVSSGEISRVAIVLVVSVGIAVMMTLGLLRILRGTPLYLVLTVVYGLIFVLALFASSEFLAISFDASGATTGAMTVPVILALSKSVSALKKNSKASEKDSFGLVGLTSTGAILGVIIMSLFRPVEKITASLDYDLSTSDAVILPFLKKIPTIALEVFFALLPILIIFVAFQKITFRLKRKAMVRILKGLLYAFLGLVLFLTGVQAGFMDVGSQLGYQIASQNAPLILILVGFILGLVTILAEPAVYVLTEQIEDVTSGYVRRQAVIGSLAIGVAAAVALSMLRIVVPEIHLWHYLLPCYAIALVLSFFTPKLFVGIAFDSGGVASGPMTATFVLAFAQGAAEAISHANVLIDGFGVIAMVATMPLIALQLLGLIYRIKSTKGGIVRHDVRPT